MDFYTEVLFTITYSLTKVTVMHDFETVILHLQTLYHA